jgi:hypothetical protein
MAGCRCIYRWDDLADKRGAEPSSGPEAEHDHAVDRLMRDHQEQCERHDQHYIKQADPDRAPRKSPKYRRHCESKKGNYGNGDADRVPDDCL